MHFDWSTLALQTINFVILVWLLNRLLYKPVLRMVDARKAEIDRQFADAETASRTAKDRLGQIEAQREALAAERESSLKTAAAEAEDLSKTRLAQAEREAEAVLADGRKKLAVEREQASAEIREGALELGLDIARRLLSEAPASASIEPIVRHLAALPNAELEELRRQLADGAALQVVTPSAIAEATAEGWRRALRQSLGETIAIDFAADPKLIAGADLHFPSALLRFSWAEALEEIKHEVGADVAAR